MKTSRRIFIKNSIGGLSALTISPLAFSSPKSRPRNSLDIAKIAKKKWNRTPLTILYPKGSLGNLKPIASEFSKASGIKINLKEGSLDNIAAEMMLDNKIYHKSNFDIALPATFNLPNLVEANVIEDLSSYAKEFEPKNFKDDILYDRGDFYKGKFYGYQADGDTYIMFLNKSFLENESFKSSYLKKTGNQLKVPKTWEELDRQIEFFHDPQNNRYGGNLFRNKDYQIWEYWVRLHGKGLLPFKDDMTPNIEHPQSIQALKEMLKINKFLDERSFKDSLFDNFKNFSEGKSYVNFGWGGTQKYLNGPNSKIKNNMTFAPLPGGVKNGKTFTVPYFNWGWNYTVSQNSNQKEVAYLFCLFASTSEISKKSVREVGGYFDPHRQGHYNCPEITKTYSKDFLKIHETCLKNSIPDLYLSGQGQYLGALKQIIHNCSLGNLTPELAFKELHKKWESITEKLGRKQQILQWSFLKKSYPQNLLKVLQS
ncbi:MAG: ABC transporter substrate-binding protein [Bacteriovoracaceae bacterium]